MSAVSDQSSPNLCAREQSSQQVAALFMRQLTTKNKLQRRETVKELKRQITKRRAKENSKKKQKRNVVLSPPPKRSYLSPIKKQSQAMLSINLMTLSNDNFSSIKKRAQAQSPLRASKRSNYIDPDEISIQIDDPFGDGGSLFSPDVAAVNEALNGGGRHPANIERAKMNKTQNAISKLMRRRIVQTIQQNTALRQSPEVGLMLQNNNFSVIELQAIELELNLKNQDNKAAEASLLATKRNLQRESSEQVINANTLYSMVSNVTSYHDKFSADEIQSLTQIRIRNEYNRSYTRMQSERKLVMYQTSRRFRGATKYFDRQFNRFTFVDPKYLISPSDGRKVSWDIMVIVLAVVKAFLVPIEISFQPEFMNSWLYFFFSLLIDIVFVVDMVLTCLTLYRDDKGNQVQDSSKIIKKYVSSFRRFIPDFLAVLGNELFVLLIPEMKILSLAKILRMLRLGQMIQQSTFPRQIKEPLNLVKYTLYLVIYINAVGCAWWSILHLSANEVDEEGQFIHWFPPMSWLNYREYNLFDEEAKSMAEVYVICLYHSVLMLGFNEMGPVNPAEIAFCAGVMLSASFINAQLFSEMVVVMHSLNKRQQRQQEMLNKSNSVLASLNMPLENQKEIQEYFYMTVNTREDQEEFDTFLDQISPSKKELVQKKVFEQNLLLNPCVQTYTGTTPPIKQSEATITDKVLRTVSRALSLKRLRTSKNGEAPPLLHSLTKRSQLEVLDEESAAFLAKLVSYLGTFLAIPEEEIINFGDKSRAMYFMSKGDCIVKMYDIQGRLYISDRLLDEGQHFGEISMIYKCKRTATVISRNFNTMARFSYNSYREVLNLYPDFQRHLKMRIFNYDDGRKKFIKKIILEVDYFKRYITQESIHELIYQSEAHLFDAGQNVLKEDQPIESILIVEYGVVEVYTEFEGHEFIIDRLHQGSIINALAFLTEDNMYVGMRCKENCKIIELSKPLIKQFQDNHPLIKYQMQRYQNIMLLSQKKYPLDYMPKVPLAHVPKKFKSIHDYEAFMDRRNTLKNVVFRRIIQLRQIKKRPKLNTLLKMFRDNGDPVEKELFIQKIRKLYKHEEDIVARNFETNPKYEQLTQYFHRIQKMLQIGKEGIQTADMKLAHLLIRRYRRESMPVNIKDEYLWQINKMITKAQQKANLIEVIDVQTAEAARLAYERAKQGFNPFYHNHFIKGRKFEEEYFQQDEDFIERRENQNALTKVVKIDGKEVLLSHFEDSINKYSNLTKLVGRNIKRKSSFDELPAFRSPLQQIDLSIFKRKKRSQLIQEYLSAKSHQTTNSQSYVSSLGLEETVLGRDNSNGESGVPKNQSQFAKIDDLLLSDDDESEQSEYIPPQRVSKPRQTFSSSGASFSLMSGTMRFGIEEDIEVSSLDSSNSSKEIQNKFMIIHSQVKQQIIREDCKNLKQDMLLLPKTRRSSVRVPLIQGPLDSVVEYL